VIELRYREDRLVLSRWLRQVVALHLVLPVRVSMHYRLPDGTEADLVLMDSKRRIEIELKETSSRVFEQALARKRYFDYVYVAVDWPVSEILTKRPAPIARILDYMRAGSNGQKR